MPKLLCLVCMTEEGIPTVGPAVGVPSGDGTKLLCSNGCIPEIHEALDMPTHCGKPMKYFAEDDVNEFRVCPD